MSTNIPLTGQFKVTCPYHKKGSTWLAGWHTGIDLVNSDKKIYGTCDGYVYKTGIDKSYGNYIVIKENNAERYHWFCHLSKFNVKKNDKVTRVSVIGEMGKTGNANGVHLHYEIRKADNVYNNTENPADYMGIPNKLGSYNTKNYQKSNEISNINKVVQDVIFGKYGNGEERKKKLEEAGYNYKEVQNLVNKKLRK